MSDQAGGGSRGGVSIGGWSYSVWWGPSARLLRHLLVAQLRGSRGSEPQLRTPPPERHSATPPPVLMETW